MILEKLKLVNFRNFKNQEVLFNKRYNIIIGNNGSGKSNLLEAIYLFYKGKSFRKASKKNLINWNNNFFRLNLFTNDEMYTDVYLYYDKKKISSMV